MRRILAALGLIVAACSPASAAYPERPIQLIVPFPAGGATDVVARLYATKLGEKLGTSIVVMNVGGAGGAIAATQAAHAKPDGYTLFFGTTGTLSINPSLYTKLSYDPVKDFQPIGLIGKSANMLLVNKTVPADDLASLIRYAKANPGKITYGSAGNGSSTHLAGALLQAEAGIDIVHVPYRGSAPATLDLIGGRITMMFETIPTGLQIIRQDGVRTFGTTSPTRFSASRDIPTIAESGLPGFDVTIWFAALAPAGTSPEIAARLAAATAEVVRLPDLSARFEEIGIMPAASSPAELATLIDADARKWGKLIRDANIRIE